jgi:cullin 1
MCSIVSYIILQLALSQWKDFFFLHIQKEDHKLAGAVLRLITLQRNGEVIDQGLVKKVVDSFVSLGLDNTDPNKECLDIYKEHLEGPFIAATDQYYKKESESFLAQNSVSDYLKKAEERLREEEDRVERYLNTKTRKELISRCEHVLIREHAERMWDSFQTLLDFDQDEDLQRMYALLSRIPEGLEPLRKRFEGHVKQAGLTAISKLVGEGGTNIDALDPKAYVDALLEVHRKNSETVTRSFKGEAGFAASLDKACREFVNRNAATGTSSTKSPELIAKHADMLLRRSNKMAEEDDLEGALNRVVCALGIVRFQCSLSNCTDGSLQVPRR